MAQISKNIAVIDSDTRRYSYSIYEHDRDIGKGDGTFGLVSLLHKEERGRIFHFIHTGVGWSRSHAQRFVPEGGVRGKRFALTTGLPHLLSTLCFANNKIPSKNI